MRCSSMLAGLLIASLLIGVGCKRVASPPLAEIPVINAATLPVDSQDAAWGTAPEYTAKLIPQDLVEPRLMEASTIECRVRALSDGSQIAFRLEWTDPTKDVLPSPSNFCDACAVQMPAKIEATVPVPQMGEKGRPVEISYWSAGWQAVVDGRGDALKDLYPRARVDHYPFQAQSLEPNSPVQQAMALRYAPAKALGNFMGGTPKSSIQDLMAEGPGTLTPAKSTTSHGGGRRTADGWATVIIRRIPEGFSTERPGQVALAIWDGSRQETGARKMRTGWIPIVLKGKP